MEKQSTPEIIVRRASRVDMPAVHELVRELAIYEKSEKEFIAGIEEYREDFNNGVFEAMVAEADGKVVGMVLYYMAYSTWKGKMLFLEDFVIKEAYRSLGIGQRLFDAFLREARDRGCRLAKWQVLDWNKPAIRFYEKNQAVIEQSWLNVKYFF